MLEKKELLEKTQVSNIVFVFSMNQKLMPCLREIKNNLPPEDSVFIITSYNNIPYPKPSILREFITPLDILGEEGISWNYRSSLTWQESIPTLQVNAENVSKNFTLDSEIPSTYLNWVFRFTPFMRSRMLVVDTTLEALSRWHPERAYLFGWGETVKWHRSLVEGCKRKYFSEIWSADASVILGKKYLPTYKKHVESESPEQPKSAEQPKSIELPILRQRDVDSWWAVTDSQLKALYRERQGLYRSNYRRIYMLEQVLSMIKINVAPIRLRLLALTTIPSHRLDFTRSDSLPSPKTIKIRDLQSSRKKKL